MANMSYCRFRNTNMDLEDCLQALRDGEELSKEEFIACKNLFNSFINFCYDEGILEEDYYKIEERLQEFFDSLNNENK